jgi:hypothetical protein
VISVQIALNLRYSDIDWDILGVQGTMIDLWGESQQKG